MSKLPILIAHRGASYVAPENTLAAIRRAWAEQSDAVEIDIHLTADGQIVVMHDATLQRTTGHPGVIADMTLADIHALDAGSWKGPEFAGEKVPTLADALAAIPAGKGIVIEIKGKDSAVVPALHRAIAAGPISPDRITLISFGFDILRLARAALPDCAALGLAGASHEGKPRDLADLDAFIAQARDAGFTGLNLSHHWPIDADFVRRIRDAGLRLYVWTVNDAARARELAELGVDGITTDRPGWLRQHL